MLDRKLLLVTGKGGVGKSAVTAGLALQAVRRGKRVLAIGMIDGGGLASHFGVDKLGYQPAEVRPGLFAMAIDRGAAIDEYMKLQVPVPSSIPTKTLSNVFGAVVDTIPGVREVVTIGKPIYEVWAERWDLVIVDGAPLGQVMSYINAPNTIEQLVPSGRIREQARRIAETLTMNSSGMVMVAIPEELPVVETLETLAELEIEQPIQVSAVVANRLLDELEVDLDGVPPGAHLDAATHHRGVWASQQHWLEVLPADSLALEFLFGMHTPSEVAARLADAFEDLP
ncbi:MAG: ArsA family ATPase [Acidimicrobiia bacterium]|nr:hypothetical protein [Acidimicrobiia bacterium]NNF65620.1 ArsA family ATPase [Acidimicrobiia bacterium]